MSLRQQPKSDSARFIESEYVDKKGNIVKENDLVIVKCYVREMLPLKNLSLEPTEFPNGICGRGGSFVIASHKVEKI
jgi:hypothetical protein